MKEDEQQDTSLAGWRSAALIAVLFGAIGSIGLLRHAQQHPPPIIIVLFVIWVLAPFLFLAGANVLSKRWPLPVRKTLYIVTLVITLASLGVYFDDNIAHRTAKPAFVWVVVPIASVIAGGIALALAALKARKL